MLIALGVSHKTAPIDVRERLAFSPEHIPDALKALMTHLALEEVALLSTCNRTEFYCSSSSPLLMNQVLSWWQQYRSTEFDMKPFMYVFSDESAVKHMMRVASGLDSMVLGEPQILGQLKTAFNTACEIGVVGKRLSRLFQSSFSIAKKVRHTTGIAVHPVSIAYSAVALAKQIFSDLSQATVMLIGAGENIELTLQHLRAREVNKFIIVNRTLEHAQNLANLYGGQALSLAEISTGLAQADIVISSIAAPMPILSQAHIDLAFLQCKRRPIFMVDLGVPRNIEPAIGLNEDIYLYTIDDLQDIVSENLKNRQIAALKAERIIEQACQAYMDWVYTQHQMMAVRVMRHNAEEVKNQLLAIALGQLDKGEDPKEVIAHFAYRLTQKLMHQPTVELRKSTIKAKHLNKELIVE